MSAKKSEGFTAEERAAMRERAKELKAEERANKNRAAGESAVLEKIAEMQASKSKEVDRALQDEGFMPTEIDDHNLRMLFKFEGKKPKGGMTTKETVVRFGLTQGGQSSEVVQAEATDQ
jgi:hypothetical protein